MTSISFTAMAHQFGMSPAVLVFVLAFLLVWSLCWKGWALWVAARKTQKTWFVVFLLVNTLGILEIVYLFLSSEHNKQDPV